MARRPTKLPTSRGFARRHGFRQAASVLFAFCEGKTEADYLREIARRYRRAAVSVEVVGQCGEPGAVSKAACAKWDELGRQRKRLRKRAATKDCLESYEVWAVFDRDEHPRFQPAIDRCQAKGVGLAVTVPCVELWAVLHIQHHAAPIERGPCQRLLKRLMPGYDHGEKAAFQVQEQMGPAAQAEATRRALRLHQAAEDSAGGGRPDHWRNPVTTLWKLVAAIEHGSSAEARTAAAGRPAEAWWRAVDPGG